MYFTVNKAFVNYLDQLDNLTNSLDILIIMDKTTFQQTLPVSLNATTFDSDLLTAPWTLRDFVHQHHCKKEVFNLQEGIQLQTQKFLMKISFLNSFTIDVFLFVTIISLLVTTLVMYILCKHMKLKILVTSLTLQQIKEVGAVM